MPTPEPVVLGWGCGCARVIRLRDVLDHVDDRGPGKQDFWIVRRS